MDIISTHLIDIFFGLISVGALTFCRFVWKKNKELQGLMHENENKKYRQMILDEIEPIIAEISQLRRDFDKFKADDNKYLMLIVDSYKFRLIQLCKTHLRDEYLTQGEFDQLSELFKLYTQLGGNGQAEEYYHKVIQLPIISEQEAYIKQEQKNHIK